MCVDVADVSLLPRFGDSTKQNHIDPKTTQSCNINNFLSFYAGPNKKFENLMLDVKRQMDEIQMELRNLTKKGHDKLKGKS